MLVDRESYTIPTKDQVIVTYKKLSQFASKRLIQFVNARQKVLEELNKKEPDLEKAIQFLEETRKAR